MFVCRWKRFYLGEFFFFGFEGRIDFIMKKIKSICNSEKKKKFVVNTASISSILKTNSAHPRIHGEKYRELVEWLAVRHDALCSIIEYHETHLDSLHKFVPKIEQYHHYHHFNNDEKTLEEKPGNISPPKNESNIHYHHPSTTKALGDRNGNMQGCVL